METALTLLFVILLGADPIDCDYVGAEVERLTLVLYDAPTDTNVETAADLAALYTERCQR